MALDAQSVEFLSVPLTCPLAVNSRLPVPEDRSVALTAQKVGFFEAYKLAACQPEDIAVIRIVAVQAPAVCFIVILELNFLVELF